jgi:hypothetical protein
MQLSHINTNTTQLSSHPNFPHLPAFIGWNFAIHWLLGGGGAFSEDEPLPLCQYFDKKGYFLGLNMTWASDELSLLPFSIEHILDK